MLTEQQVVRLLDALHKQTKAMNEQAKALTRLAESNMALADAVFAQEGQDEEGDSPQVDMAGRPIRAS